MLNISQSLTKIVANTQINANFNIGIVHLPGLLALRLMILTFCTNRGEKW